MTGRRLRTARRILTCWLLGHKASRMVQGFGWRCPRCGAPA